MNLYNTRVLKPVHFDRRIKSPKSGVLRMPTASVAGQAGVTPRLRCRSTSLSLLDYSRLAKALEPLVERMAAARAVQIAGRIDLRFSIEGIPVVPCVAR